MAKNMPTFVLLGATILVFELMGHLCNVTLLISEVTIPGIHN
jgi:hypothetical protein